MGRRSLTSSRFSRKLIGDDVNRSTARIRRRGHIHPSKPKPGLAGDPAPVLQKTILIVWFGFLIRRISRGPLEKARTRKWEDYSRLPPGSLPAVEERSGSKGELKWIHFFPL